MNTTPDRSTKPALPERRVSVRHPRNLRVKWRRLGSRNYEYQPATVPDISTTGLALIFDECCQTGTVLIVQPEGVADRFAEPMLLKVAWATRQKNNTWKVGCSFTNPFSEADLKALLESARQSVLSPAPAVKQPSPKDPAAGARQPAPKVPAAGADPFVDGSADERRKAVRRERFSVAVLISRSDGKTEVDGSVVDRSLTGLGIVVHAPYPRGTFLKVRPRKENVAPVQVLVRNCRQEGNEWLLGCHFTQAPTANVFMLFG